MCLRQRQRSILRRERCGFLGKQSLRSVLNTECSELSRRLAYGISMMASLVKSFGYHLCVDKARTAESGCDQR